MMDRLVPACFVSFFCNIMCCFYPECLKFSCFFMFFVAFELFLVIRGAK